MNQVFTSGGLSIGVSASASVLTMNIQDWFPLGWTGWISLLSKGLSRVFSNTTVQKHQLVFQCSAFFIVQLSHPYMTTGKPIALARQTFVGKVISLHLDSMDILTILIIPIYEHGITFHCDCLLYKHFHETQIYTLLDNFQNLCYT